MSFCLDPPNSGRSPVNFHSIFPCCIFLLLYSSPTLNHPGALLSRPSPTDPNPNALSAVGGCESAGSEWVGLSFVLGSLEGGFLLCRFCFVVRASPFLPWGGSPGGAPSWVGVGVALCGPSPAWVGPPWAACPPGPPAGGSPCWGLACGGAACPARGRYWYNLQYQ